LTTPSGVIADLLDQLPEREKLWGRIGDGAYDTKQAYEAVIGHGATAISLLEKLHE